MKTASRARINGKKCLVFYDKRVKQIDAPLDYPFIYHLRHDEDDWSQPVNIEPCVWVNFFGSVCMKTPLEFNKSGYIEIESFFIEEEYIKFRLRNSIFATIFGLD